MKDKTRRNKQEFNGQLVEKKYNKKERKGAMKKGNEKGMKRGLKRAIAPLQRGENSTKLCPTGLTSEHGNWNCTNV